MADRDSKRYYWLKLEKDFFKRHDIRIIEGMPNGKDYIIFYLKLLCESTSHEGYLRFSETIPYNETMLSTITNTNIDIVRSAIKIFTELQMMQILDDGTLYFNQVAKMIGSETGQTIRKREAKLLQNNESGKFVVKNNLDIEKEKDKELDIEIEKDNNVCACESLKNLITEIEKLIGRSLTNAEYITIEDFTNTMSEDSILRDIKAYSDKASPIAYMKKAIEKAHIESQAIPLEDKGGSEWLDDFNRKMRS